MARYALIIGIAEYVGSFKSLETPVQNANAIAEILDRYGDFNQVKRLPFRREAGQKDLGSVIRKPLPHATLVQELQQFLQDANGSDVLLYYSGHGFTKLDPLSHTPEGFLAPSDCQVELDANGQIIAERNGISLAGLNALINRHTFNSLVVILDCCNSGAFLESSMVRRDVTAFGYERDYYLITACRSSSKAYEGEEYSLLTAAVLKGLSQTNAAPETGRISGDRLFDVVGNELQNSRQEPIRMGWGRLITLVRYLQPPESAESVSQSFNPANPYMGLKPFEREQADYFFGREQAVRSLLERLDENRFLAVIGPSGCGKSSLVKAGLLPELENDRIPSSRDWQVEIITPGQYPLQALTNALERHRSDAHPLVLFVDQFEELFTLCPNEEEQRTFIKRLDQETNDLDRKTRIIIALRGDFLDRCAKFQESADLINSTAPTTYIVTPLTEAKLVAELEESITCPAGLHGVSFESGLVARIVDDVINQPGAMPLLQYALTQLWDTCISPNGVSRLLTIQSYDAIEGVKGALQRWADQFYTNLSPNDQAFVREMVGELVQLGDEGEVTRRRASWERLRELASSQEQLDRIIGQLVYQRLLVADDKTVEVAHEALLKESRLIQGWIEDNRESIRLQQRLEIYRREWEEHDLSENYLLDAGRLAAIDEWIERKQPRLTSVDQEFIELSRGRRDRQFRSQLEQERRLREAAEATTLAEIEKKLEAEARVEAETAKARETEARIKIEKQKQRWAVSAALLSLGIGFLSVNLKQQLEEKDEAIANSSIVEVLPRLTNNQQIEALIDGIKVAKRLKSIRRLSPAVLQNVVFSVQERNRLQGHTSRVNSVSFSSDGEYLVSGSKDSTMIVWKKSGEVLKRIPYNTDYGIRKVVFSRNGEFIASADTNGDAKLWKFKSWDLHIFRPENSDKDDYATSISFSPQDHFLAVSIANDKKDSGTINIWDTKSHKSIKTSEKLGKLPKILSIAFSPVENILVIGDVNGDLRTLDVDTGRIKLWRGHRNAIRGIAFSPTGKIFATASNDRLVKIWMAKSGQLLQVLDNHKDEVNDISFNLTGTTLASASRDGTLRIWSTNSGKELEILRGHSGGVNSVSFSSSENFLASAGDDSTIRFWNTGISSDSRSEQIPLTKLIDYSCNALKDYFLYNQNLSEKDRKLCTNP